MKQMIRSSLAAATLSLAFATVSFAAEEAGYVDFGHFTAAPDCQFVEVNLQPGLMKFASKIVSAQEPEVADMLKNIRHVRVNVVGLDATNKAATLERMASIRSDLEKKGWEKVVTARQGKEKGGDDVAIFMKTQDEAIQGIVVTVIEDKGNAVFVNVVGEIRAEQLAALGEHLDIKPLSKLKLQHHKEKAAPEKTEKAST